MNYAYDCLYPVCKDFCLSRIKCLLTGWPWSLSMIISTHHRVTCKFSGYAALGLVDVIVLDYLLIMQMVIRSSSLGNGHNGQVNLSISYQFQLLSTGAWFQGLHPILGYLQISSLSCSKQDIDWKSQTAALMNCLCFTVITFNSSLTWYDCCCQIRNNETMLACRTTETAQLHRPCTHC